MAEHITVVTADVDTQLNDYIADFRLDWWS